MGDYHRYWNTRVGRYYADVPMATVTAAAASSRAVCMVGICVCACVCACVCKEVEQVSTAMREHTEEV